MRDFIVNSFVNASFPSPLKWIPTISTASIAREMTGRSEQARVGTAKDGVAKAVVAIAGVIWPQTATDALGNVFEASLSGSRYAQLYLWVKRRGLG